LFACFVVVIVTCMGFASGVKELRRDTLIMLETYIMMSSLIFHLVLILEFRLALTLELHLALLLMLCIVSLMKLTIAHKVLVHERTALSLDALVTVHVLIVVIVSRIFIVFLLQGLTLTLSPDTSDGPYFLRHGSHPISPNGEVQKTVKTSSGCLVKC
jgi:hypothetical protein